MIDYPHNCTILYYEDEKIYKYWKIKFILFKEIMIYSARSFNNNVTVYNKQYLISL